MPTEKIKKSGVALFITFPYCIPEFVQIMIGKKKKKKKKRQSTKQNSD